MGAGTQQCHEVSMGTDRTLEDNRSLLLGNVQEKCLHSKGWGQNIKVCKHVWDVPALGQWDNQLL